MWKCGERQMAEVATIGEVAGETWGMIAGKVANWKGICIEWLIRGGEVGN
jgi:hypothetical protein